MIRKSQCACGQVSAMVEGDPAKVLLCHCDFCQKRTGSVLNVTCYFRHEQVLELKGETLVFSDSPNSIGIRYEFCPHCGTTVHWTYGPAMEAAHPGMTQYRRFAVGCFADPEFPTPTTELQRQYAHPWMPEFDGLESFAGFPEAE